jgi:hypothetical protein
MKYEILKYFALQLKLQVFIPNNVKNIHFISENLTIKNAYHFLLITKGRPQESHPTVQTRHNSRQRIFRSVLGVPRFWLLRAKVRF